MVGRVLFLGLFCTVLCEPVLLNEGEVYLEAVRAEESYPVYRLQLEQTEKKKQLVVLSKLYSGQNHPRICLQSHPNDSADCLFSDDSSPGQIIVPSAQLAQLSSVFLSVACSLCRFSLCYRYSKPISLRSNTSLTETITAGDPSLFTARVNETPMRVHMQTLVGEVTLEVRFRGNTGENELVEVKETWSGGVFAILSQQCDYSLTIHAWKAATYTISTSSVDLEASEELITSEIALSEVESGSYKRYSLEIMEPKAFLAFHLTQYSGDSDLYVSSKSPPTCLSYEFKADSIGNEFLFIGAEDRKRVGKATGTYYVAVYGKVTGAFGLEARAEQGIAKPMIVGLREYGSVREGKLVQYQVLLPQDSAGKLVAGVEVQSGNVHLYAKLCTENAACQITKEELASPASYIFSANIDEVEVPYRQCQGLCLVALAVQGVSSGTGLFFLDVSLNSTQLIALSSARPYSTVMPAKGDLYFKYYEAEEVTEMVEFLVTPISGNPDLYMSTKIKRPSVTTAERISIQSGLLVDCIQYRKALDRLSLQGNYYLTVHSDLPSAFTLAVFEHRRTETEAEELLPGVPQEVQCEFSDLGEPCSRRFTFYLAGEERDIRLILISMRGETVLKATCGLETASIEGNYHWSIGAEAVYTIHKEDKHYCATGVYTVLAETRMTVKEPARYQILFSAGQPILIGPNLPFVDSLEANQTNYYRIRISLANPSSIIRLKIQALAGRTESYLSYSLQYPNSTHNDMKWKGFRQVELQDCGEPCNAFVAVRGITNANYTIVVEKQQNDVVEIAVGQLISGVVGTDYAYYVVHFKREMPAHILVQPINFDVNVYVNVQRDSAPLVLPTQANSQYKGENGLLLAESITINPNDAQTFCQEWSCSLLIGILGYARNSHFDLEVDQSNVPLLLEAKGRDVTLKASSVTHFRFYLAYEHTVVLVSLTRISGGDPDLYISRLGQAGKDHYEWKGESYGSDFITISPQDQIFGGRSMRGFYYIAVVADRKTRARVAFVTNAALPIQLIPGTPQGAVTQAGEISYFYIGGAQDLNLQIALTPFHGHPTLYVTTQDLVTEDLFERLPGPNNYIWRVGPPARDLLISKQDPNFCSSCNYVIGIEAANVTTSFSLVATHEMEMTVLQTGVPSKGSVDSHEFVYYYYPIEAGLTELKVTVMGLSGDVDLFIGFKVPLTLENAERYSQSPEGLEEVEITESLLEGYEFLYIGVYGAKASAYLVLLTSSAEDYIRLVEGWSGYYAVHFSPLEPLLFEYSGKSTAICKISTPSRNFHLDIFTQEAASKTRPQPGPENYDHWYNTTSETFDEYMNQVRFRLEGGKSGRHRIAVQGRETKWHEKREFLPFSLYCGDEGETIVLKAGAEDQDTLSASRPSQSYLLDIPKNVQFEAYLSACCGAFTLTAISTNTGDTVPALVLRPGVLFLSFKSASESVILRVEMEAEDKDLSGASYHLATRSAGNGIRQRSIAPGNNGDVYAETTASTVSLRWAPVIYLDDESPVSAPAVLYRVYMSAESEVALSSYCALRIAVKQHRARRLTHEDLVEPHFEFERPHGSIVYLTVIAQLTLPDYSYYFSYVHYDAVETQGAGESQGRDWTETVGWTLGGLGVLCGLALGARCLRKREDSRRSAEYEMMSGR